MAASHEELEPEFLRMAGPSGTSTGAGEVGNGQNMGWPSQNVAQPKTIVDDAGRITRVRTPVMDLEGLMTPTHLFYVVQHFAVPEPVSPKAWRLTVDGVVKQLLEITYEDLRRLPARTVRTVMECSGSDANYFEYFQGIGQKPRRREEAMILSAGEFTGIPLAAILECAGLGSRAAHVRVEGWDEGVPASAAPGTKAFFYDKGLPLEKALHPDTILAWAMNGELLEHLHGAPVRLVVPGWSGNWSVKWVRRIDVLEQPPDCWYHYNFYYYGNSPSDPDKELITTIGVKSIVTYPRDDQTTLSSGLHVLRGRAWSGGGSITKVEVSVDGGESWQAAHLEEPRERWMWVRWSYLWDAQPGRYRIMSRATDEIGRVQPRQPRYNNMRKNFNAIVGYDITIA
jgi:DMSO/TMAO reductase YedYZ molybdopterin-dependent catalytic subunit